MVLSEINSEKQVAKHHFTRIKEVKSILLLDHHEESFEELIEALNGRDLNLIHDPSQTSVCEVL